MHAIKVAFLGIYFEAWDALGPIYELMKADPRFEPLVLSMPRKLTGELRYEGEQRSHEFFESQGIDHIRLNKGGSGGENRLGLEALRELAPDYTFTNYPWQRNYQPALRFDQLVKFTRLAYVPYFSLAMVVEPDHEPGGGQADGAVATHLYQQRLHQLASLIFTQDANVLEAHQKSERGAGHVFLTGSPKIDTLREAAVSGLGSWPLQGEGYRLVWAPHHSYSPHWLNFGVFAGIKDQMLELAKQRPDMQIVLRPHPFMWGTLADRGVLPQEEIDDWRKQWGSLSNTATSEGGSYGELFLATDALLTDGISFLAEFPLVTGTASIFFEKPNHWEFSPIGELAASCSVRVRTFEELVDVLNQIQQKGNLDRTEQIAKLVEAVSPNPGNAAQLIVDQVYKDFKGIQGPSSLVDPSSITQTPWELVPGREPFED